MSKQTTRNNVLATPAQEKLAQHCWYHHSLNPTPRTTLLCLAKQHDATPLTKQKHTNEKKRKLIQNVRSDVLLQPLLVSMPLSMSMSMSIVT